MRHDWNLCRQYDLLALWIDTQLNCFMTLPLQLIFESRASVAHPAKHIVKQNINEEEVRDKKQVVRDRWEPHFDSMQNTFNWLIYITKHHACKRTPNANTFDFVNWFSRGKTNLSKNLKKILFSQAISNNIVSVLTKAERFVRN